MEINAPRLPEYDRVLDAGRALSVVGAEGYAAGKYVQGAKLFEEISASDDYVLTLPAYRAID